MSNSAMELLYRDGMREKRSDELEQPEDNEPGASGEHDGAEQPVEAAGAVVAILDEDAKVTVTFETQPDVPAGTRRAEPSEAGTSPVSKAEPATSPPFLGSHQAPDGHAVVEEWEGQDWTESRGARRADALRLLAETYLAGGWRQLSAGTPFNSSADRYQVVVHIDQALLSAGLLDVSPSKTLSQPHRCAIESGPALALDTVRRLACESTLVGIVDDEHGEPLSVGRKTRAIPPAPDRALRARDGGCRFPSCDRTLFLHAHHVVHWANGGETKLSNLVSVCTFHHWLLHEGGFKVEAAGDGGFVFYDPSGRPLLPTGRVPYHTLDTLARAAAEKRVAIVDANRALDHRISAETAACRWAGERMDYHMTVGGLVCFRGRARQRAQH